MNCLFCGIELTRKTQKKYCSVPCQKAHGSALAYKERIRICETCGKGFVMHRLSGKAKRGEVKEGRFCSRACHFEWVRRQPKKLRVIEKKKPHHGACSICGKAFESRYKRSRCGRECDLEYGRRELFKSNSMKKTLKPRQCKECGKTFVPEYGNKRRVFCSDTCFQRYSNKTEIKNARKKARTNGVYYEYINPLEVFKRDNWHCQLCGKKLNPKHRGTIRDDAPELDHIIPWAQGGEHSYRNTQCTCRKCNQKKGARELGQLRLFG